MEEPELSPRDQKYLDSPGFESYMIAGYVFVGCMTISLVVPVLIGHAYLFWPGLLLSIVAMILVLNKLKRREYKAKLREIRDNPSPQKRR
jgi:hypothetical protein